MPFQLAVKPIRGLLLFALTALAAAGAADAAVFIDAAGRRVALPDRIERILPAEQDAEVLVFTLAPHKLPGLERRTGRTAARAGGTRLPALRFRSGATPDSVVEAAREYRADLIIDAGPVTPERTAFAEAVQQQAGIPYILVDDSFDRTSSVLQRVGVLLGEAERGHKLRKFADNAIDGMRGRLLIQPPDARPRVYYGLGPDGLTTPLPGSPAGAAIDEAGAINVAAPLGRGAQVRTSRDQLLAWDPEIIIAADPRFYNALRRDRAWRRLSAVRARKIYLEPGSPFGWLAGPPGINRLIGLYWLSTVFYPAATQDELRGVACDFYDTFYRTRLTNARLDAMLRPAGGLPEKRPQPGGAAPSALGLTGAAPPPLPGTVSGLPGTPGVSSAGFVSPLEAPQAPCTIPGVAAAMTGFITGPGQGANPGANPGAIPAEPGFPAPVPGGRARPGLPAPAPPGNLR